MTERIYAVSGSRRLKGPAVTDALYHIFPDRVLVGDCPTGADRAARDWCRANKVPCEVFRADWTQGRKAGPLRNGRLVARAVELRAKALLAFPRGGPGTADCMCQARAVGLRIVKL